MLRLQKKIPSPQMPFLFLLRNSKPTQNFSDSVENDTQFVLRFGRCTLEKNL